MQSADQYGISLDGCSNFLGFYDNDGKPIAVKVLSLSHLFPNASAPFSGIFVAEIVKALSEKVESEVLAPISWFPLLRGRSQIPQETKINGVPVIHPSYLALPRFALNFRWTTYYRAISRQLEARDFRPEVIHAHWLYPDAFAAAKWAKKRGIKTVVTIHGHASLGLGTSGVATPRIEEALQLVDQVIAVSSELKQAVCELYSVPESRVEVVHNGIDPLKFAWRPKEEARRTLGLALNRPLLLMVARLSPEKQIHRLIEAIAMCQVEGLQLYVVGDGPLRNKLAQKVNGMGLSSRVKFLGGVVHDQLANWFYAADVFCLTSAHEGCPVVVHEALACGRPVVSTPVGAVPDLIPGPDFGILTPDQPASIVEAISQAFCREWDQDEIANWGRRSNWGAVADQTIEIFRKVIG